MSDIRARYVGSEDAVHLTVPVSTDGEPDRHVTVPHGGELPAEIDGHKVPASFRDTLREQPANWTRVDRSKKDEDDKPAAKPAAKTDNEKKEA